LIDILALGMLGALWLRRKQFKLTPWPPGSTVFWLYFAFSALSVVNAGEPLFVAFELFKMVRMYLLFWVVSHWIQNPRQLQWFLRAVALVMLYIFYEMLNQKYRLGLWQAKGPFPHQNSLVMYVNLFNCLLFSYVLNQSAVQPPSACFGWGFWLWACCVRSLPSPVAACCFWPWDWLWSLCFRIPQVRSACAKQLC
jgi:hypothetical protein